MTVTFAAGYPSLTVEIGLATTSSGTGVWGGSLWNTATWGPDAVWTDVSAYVRGFNINRGRSRETDRYTGSASVTFANRDARFTPANLAGPYVAGGVSQIRARLPLRISATWNSMVYKLFYGFVDVWQDGFPQYGMDAFTVASCSDSLSLLAKFNGTEQPSQGAGEFAGPRIQRILANAKWSLGTNVAYGVKTMQPTTLANNASTELFLTADSDGGAFWAEVDGTFTYDDGAAPWSAGREKTSQVTFGPAPSEVWVEDVQTSMASDLQQSIISYARAGGTQQTVSDLTALSLYGPSQYARSDLICESDTQVAGLASLDLARFKDPEYRPVQVTCQGAVNPTVMWPHLLGRRIRDRSTVKVNVTASGTTQTYQSVIEGMSHSVTATPLSWSTSFQFSAAGVYDAFTPGALDSAVWDSASWFY